MNNDSNKMYLGIDLHKKYSYMSVVDNNGYVQQTCKVDNDFEEINKFLDNWANVNIEATVESCYGWYWMVDHIQSRNIKIHLANPLLMKQYGKAKTDKIDATRLANKLRVNDLPTCYIANKEERELRELLRHRMYLVRTNSVRKNRIRNILAKVNIRCPYTSVSGKKTKEWLLDLDISHVYKLKIENLLESIEFTENQIHKTEKYAMKICKSFDLESMNLLKTIPGVGEILAMTLIAEIGDITRFHTSHSLAMYSGVVPRVMSSGGKEIHRSIIRQSNKYIRWALGEAVTHTARKDERLKEFYKKLVDRKGKKKAKVACMNKLIKYIYHMLRNNESFEELKRG